MKRLIQWRQNEVHAVNREKELIDILVAMSHKLEEYMEGLLNWEEKSAWFDCAAAETSIQS